MIALLMRRKRFFGWTLISLSALGIGWQAWQVGYLWLDMFYFGPTFLASPFWFVERGLYTALSFYPTAAILRLLHRNPVWMTGLIGVAAVGLCFTGLILNTFWELPVFVGLHALALAGTAFRFRQAGDIEQSQHRSGSLDGVSASNVNFS